MGILHLDRWIAMLIRRMRTEDMRKIVSLWYDVSLDAHDFISSEYWKKNKKMMEREYLPNSETFVSVEDNEIVGFISMRRGNNLAALFVHKSSQSKGLGSKLLEYVKGRRKTIYLSVYKKNYHAIQFYLNRGFSIVSERKDENTNELEYVMEWNK